MTIRIIISKFNKITKIQFSLMLAKCIKSVTVPANKSIGVKINRVPA